MISMAYDMQQGMFQPAAFRFGLENIFQCIELLTFWQFEQDAHVATQCITTNGAVLDADVLPRSPACAWKLPKLGALLHRLAGLS